MISKAIKVHKRDVKKTLDVISEAKLLDRTLKITKIGDHIVVPVTDYPEMKIGESTFYDFKERVPFRNPYKEIKENLVRRGINPDIIPEKWVRYGDSLLLRLDTDKETSRIIADEFRKVLGVSSVYRLTGAVEGIHRIPSVELLIGNGGDTVHIENGIKYIFDPQKIMFSPGNVNERVGMKNESLDGKVVLDMFCGIGYFSLPLAVYCNPKKIYACDINPTAIDYLKRNSIKNGVENKIVPITGDSRDIRLNEKVDYIVMGNFKSVDYLPDAIAKIKPGGTIILHHIVSSERIPEIKGMISEKAKEVGVKIDVINTHIVKSYGPNQWHFSTKLFIH